MNAIVTVCIGENYKKLAEVTHPTLREYAKKINAEFYVINENNTKATPHWAKFNLFELFNKYNRIIFVDTDIIIREDCPNLFEIVPEDKLGIFNEGKYVNRLESIREAVMKYKEGIDKWKNDYYNTGLMVLSRIHKQLFKLPKVIHEMGMYEQPYLNLRILNDNYKVYELPYLYNRMYIMDNLIGESRLNSYIIHYAGFTISHMSTLPEKINIDILQWKEDKKNNYFYSKNLYIKIGGGLGDQIATEPVVRYIKEKIYPNCNLVISSFWPRIYDTYTDSTVISPKQEKEYFSSIGDISFFKMETMPDTTNELWHHLVHTMSHTIDFSSIATIHKTIPDKDKIIHLNVNEESFSEIKDIINDKIDLSELVLIHPGKGWPSKTFPSEWWSEIINTLAKENIKIGIIGKYISNEQGYVNLDLIESDNIYDFRDLLSLDNLIALISKAKILITNDSSPLHIAGAFNNWIILIPTCKHPDHINPYRIDENNNPSKYYKIISLYKKLTVDYIDCTPTKVEEQTLDWVKGDILDYIPDTIDVINNVKMVISKIK